MANFKRKKRKIKTVNGYLPGDGPRGNSKSDQTKQEKSADERAVAVFACCSECECPPETHYNCQHCCWWI